MRYRPKNVAALHIALAGLPDEMQVEAGGYAGLSAKTVGELRSLTAWPENLVIVIPAHRHPEDLVRVGKATVATRFSPKP
jgi:hypothetical protein